MKIPLNDSLSISLEIVFDDLSLANASGVSMGYRSPYGNVGTWTATINSTKVEAKVAKNILTELGDYYVYPIVIFADDVYTGTASKVEVVNPWENIN
jgi:hypothetical protein